MSNVVKLPTAATTHLAVRKVGNYWRVDLVTPLAGLPPLRTERARSDVMEAAIDFARKTAEKKQRPLILPRGVA